MKKIIRCAIEKYFIDSYIISFPKSGRTWLKTVIHHYIGSLYGYDMANSFVAKEGKYPKIRIRKRKRVPLIYFTHDVADIPYQDNLSYCQLEDVFNVNRYARRKNIFLMRDPRDVLVSYNFNKNILEPTRGNYM